MVLSVHVKGYLQIPSTINSVFGIGAYGVALYFLLSGYFAHPSVHKSNSLKDYAWKKTTRILPMYYASLGLTFVVGIFITGEYPLDVKWLYHVVFLNMFIPAKEWSWWNSVNFFWTMPAFIAWYIFSPFLFKWVNNTRKLAVLTLIASCGAPFLKKWMYTFANEQFVNWNFFCLMYVFLFGALAYFAVTERKHIEGMLYGAVIVILGFAVGNRSGFFVFGTVFYFLILVTNMLPFKWSDEKVNTAIKQFSGITYSVYLTHWFVLQIVGAYFKQLPWLVSYIIFVIAAGIVGFAAYKWIEIPVAQILAKRKE